MAVHTRSMTARKRTLAIYRRRVKFSRCRGRKGPGCTRKVGCKKARGTKRRFCRKTTNRHV